MVKINKRLVPPHPISSEKDYRNNPNLAALAEDCRFRKQVADERKKNNTDNVVKHSPGSIAQP